MISIYNRPGPQVLGVRRSVVAAAAALAVLSACTVGPDYVRPTMDVPAAYKGPGPGPWKTAEPQAADSQHPWWTAYQDDTLNGLMQDAERANQNIRQAEAQYREARALADAARAGLYPTAGISTGVGRGRSNTLGVVRTGNDYTLSATASWEPDLWGAVRRAIEAGEAGAQASADDLAAAHLSIQSSLAQDYVMLRITDQLRDLFATTTDAYARALKLTRAQNKAGVALLSDVALAESQLTTAQAQAVDLDTQRTQLEHAIAVLTGRAPAQFTLAALPADHPVGLAVPPPPAALPSQLLERRPDIAAAERRAAQANANIGVARAAYYPSLLLSASGGYSAGALSSFFDAPSRIWSLGASLAQTIFDGGLRTAHDNQAVAAYDVTVAQYKQTVLTGFQQVEDNLAALSILDREADYQSQAVKASQLAERLALSQYRAGTTTYLSVVTAQTLSLGNQRAAVQLRGRQIAASVSLITAMGGGWDGVNHPEPVASNPIQKSPT
jgi:NodT family efflux transporter outer membrane factor (OMF) lipoprotein